RFNESSFRMLTKLEVGAHIYDRSELRKHFPQFQAGSAFFDPHGGVLLASRSLETFAFESGSHGVRILRKHVTRFRDMSGLEIETAEGETIRAKKLVVAVGTCTNSMLKDGISRLILTRQQVVYLKPSPDFIMVRP